MTFHAPASSDTVTFSSFATRTFLIVYEPGERYQ